MTIRTQHLAEDDHAPRGARPRKRSRKECAIASLTIYLFVSQVKAEIRSCKEARQSETNKIAGLTEIADGAAKLNVQEVNIESQISKLNAAVDARDMEALEAQQRLYKLKSELRSIRYERYQLEILAECILVGPIY
jgi:hypothetical protein